jgi:threonine dehydratase
MTTTDLASHRLRLDQIRAASERIDPVFLRTPQFVCEPLAADLGCELVVKVEVLNPLRSFKGRGADWFLQRARAGGDRRPLVCASAGNWGQAMAYACRARGEPVRVFAAETVNPLKAERMRALGATLQLAGHDFDEAKTIARAFCRREGAWLVEDGLEREISEGAGSIAVELLNDPRPFDAVLVPLGNGAMLNGMARWIKAHAPATRVIGVSAAGAPAMEQSWRQRRIVAHEAVHTIADGVAVRNPIPEAVDDMQGIVDEVLLVEDSLTLEAMRAAHRHLGLVLEPSGALGVAAVLAARARFAGQRVATVLCGGNLPEADVRRMLLA